MPAAKKHTAFGVTTTLAGHAVKAGITAEALRERMKKGKTLEEALSRPKARPRNAARTIESQLIAIQNMRWAVKHERRLARMSEESTRG